MIKHLSKGDKTENKKSNLIWWNVAAFDQVFWQSEWERQLPVMFALTFLLACVVRFKYDVGKGAEA